MPMHKQKTPFPDCINGTSEKQSQNNLQKAQQRIQSLLAAWPPFHIYAALFGKCVLKVVAISQRVLIFQNQHDQPKNWK